MLFARRRKADRLAKDLAFDLLEVLDDDEIRGTEPIASGFIRPGEMPAIATTWPPLDPSHLRDYLNTQEPTLLGRHRKTDDALTTPDHMAEASLREHMLTDHGAALTQVAGVRHLNALHDMAHQIGLGHEDRPGHFVEPSTGKPTAIREDIPNAPQYQVVGKASLPYTIPGALSDHMFWANTEDRPSLVSHLLGTGHETFDDDFIKAASLQWLREAHAESHRLTQADWERNRAARQRDRQARERMQVTFTPESGKSVDLTDDVRTLTLSADSTLFDAQSYARAAGGKLEARLMPEVPKDARRARRQRRHGRKPKPTISLDYGKTSRGAAFNAMTHKENFDILVTSCDPVTVATITLGAIEGKAHVITGVAKCNPTDRFNRDLGADLAIARAIAGLGQHLEKTAQDEIDERCRRRS